MNVVELFSCCCHIIARSLYYCPFDFGRDFAGLTQLRFQLVAYDWAQEFYEWSKQSRKFYFQSNRWLYFARTSRATLFSRPRREMIPHVYLSVEIEDTIIASHRFLFGFSACINALACFCLFQQTPDMQSEIKFYLYYMQVSRRHFAL